MFLEYVWLVLCWYWSMCIVFWVCGEFGCYVGFWKSWFCCSVCRWYWVCWVCVGLWSLWVLCLFLLVVCLVSCLYVIVGDGCGWGCFCMLGLDRCCWDIFGYYCLDVFCFLEWYWLLGCLLVFCLMSWFCRVLYWLVDLVFLFLCCCDVEWMFCFCILWWLRLSGVVVVWLVLWWFCWCLCWGFLLGLLCLCILWLVVWWIVWCSIVVEYVLKWVLCVVFEGRDGRGVYDSWLLVVLFVLVCVCNCYGFCGVFGLFYG